MVVTFRGKTFSREDVERAMEKFDRETRDNFRHWKRYSVKHNDKHYPPKELLRLLGVNVKNLSGGDPANRSFRKLGFDIGIGEVGDETEPVTTEEAVEEAIETALSIEADLEDALVLNLGQLEPGLRLYEPQRGRQFNAEAAGRIDLLAVDAKDNLVVIELKAGDADRQVCGQIQAYMGWVKVNLAGPRSVRGIIVAHQFTERAKLAATVVPLLSLKTYRVNFAFSDA